MFAVSRLNGLSFTLMSVTVHGVKTGFPPGNTPCFLRASLGIVVIYFRYMDDLPDIISHCSSCMLC